MKLRAIFILFGTGLLVLFLSPQSNVKAQDTCLDAAGGVIPCPTTEKEIKNTPRSSAIPPTITYTPSFTPTSTSTQAPTSTPTSTLTSTVLPPSITPTATPLPPQGSAMWMPGIGIGAFILLIIVSVLLPAVQKIRVSQRE